jgi:hypothetical protein
MRYAVVLLELEVCHSCHAATAKERRIRIQCPAGKVVSSNRYNHKTIKSNAIAIAIAITSASA